MNRMNDCEGIDERIVINVKAFSKELSIKNRSADLEDIEQELMLHVIKGVRNFDPNLGDYDHFLRRIPSCAGKNILKRNFYRLHTYQLEGNIADTSFTSTDLIDLQMATESFLNRYKLICSLLKQCSVIKITKIAVAARKINFFGELNNLDVVIKIGVEHDKNGQHQDKNRVIAIITPDHFSCLKFINGQDIPWSM